MYFLSFIFSFIRFIHSFYLFICSFHSFVSFFHFLVLLIHLFCSFNCFVHSFVLLVHSFIHSFIPFHSFLGFVYLLYHSFFSLLQLFHSFIHFVHSFVHSIPFCSVLSKHSFINSIISFIQSARYLYRHSLTFPFRHINRNFFWAVYRHLMKRVRTSVRWWYAQSFQIVIHAWLFSFISCIEQFLFQGACHIKYWSSVWVSCLLDSCDWHDKIF